MHPDLGARNALIKSWDPELLSAEAQYGEAELLVVLEDLCVEDCSCLDKIGERDQIEARHDIGRRSSRHDVTIRHHDHGTGQTCDLWHRMADIDNRHLRLVVEALQVRKDLSLTRVIE